jgi:hypothetical protein
MNIVRNGRGCSSTDNDDNDDDDDDNDDDNDNDGGGGGDGDNEHVILQWPVVASNKSSEASCRSSGEQSIESRPSAIRGDKTTLIDNVTNADVTTPLPSRSAAFRHSVPKSYYGILRIPVGKCYCTVYIVSIAMAVTCSMFHVSLHVLLQLFYLAWLFCLYGSRMPYMSRPTQVLRMNDSGAQHFTRA